MKIITFSDSIKWYWIKFAEGVVAYSIPQGMVRGSMLELMDHTFDGHEDSLSGDLRGGLGQLVDGVYGWNNFKAAGINGHVKGKKHFMPVR